MHDTFSPIALFDRPRCLPLLALLCALLASTPASAEPAAELQRAVELYGEGQFQEAAKLLEGARAAAKEPRLLGKILLQLGITYGVLGEEAKAKKAFEEALESDPTISLDPESVKPKVAALFKAAKGAPKGRLSVRSTPPGAEVLVDGQPVGKTPLEGVRVLAGQRAVEVSLSGHHSDRRSLAITENQESRFEVTLAVRPSPVRPGTRRWVAGITLGGLVQAAGMAKSVTPLPTMFALGQEIGFHAARRSSGFYLGLALREAFGSNETFDVGVGSVQHSHFSLSAGLKLAWDIQLSSRVGFYLCPGLTASYVLLSRTPESASAIRSGGVAVEPFVDLRLVVVDRLVLYLRPLGLETVIDVTDGLEDGYLLRYDLSFGIGATF